MDNIKAISIINNTVDTDADFSEEMLSSLLFLANSMPGIAYWKSISGVYLWHNNFTEDHEVIFKLNDSIKSIVGKTDYDFFPQHIADGYRKDDLEAIISKNGTVKEEIFYNKHNIEEMTNNYNTILQPLKDIMLLLNLIETTCESDSVLSLLFEINEIVNHIFDNFNKQKNNIVSYV